jgi:hypothetical protein
VGMSAEHDIRVNRGCSKQFSFTVATDDEPWTLTADTVHMTIRGQERCWTVPLTVTNGTVIVRLQPLLTKQFIRTVAYQYWIDADRDGDTTRVLHGRLLASAEG